MTGSATSPGHGLVQLLLLLPGLLPGVPVPRALHAVVLWVLPLLGARRRCGVGRRNGGFAAEAWGGHM